MARYVPKTIALAHPLRRTILELVDGQPGITLTQLALRLECKPSTILWHTTKLRKADLVRSAKVGQSRIFYLVAGGNPLRDLTIEKTHLGNAFARQIHDVVAQRPGITLRGICECVAISSTSIRWHVRRLVDAGLLCLGEEGGRAAHFYPRAAPGAPCMAQAAVA